MCEAHQEEIEFLRKNIENLSFSRDEINDTMSNGKKLNKKNIIYNKTGKKIFNCYYTCFTYFI